MASLVRYLHNYNSIVTKQNKTNQINSILWFVLIVMVKIPDYFHWSFHNVFSNECYRWDVEKKKKANQTIAFQYKSRDIIIFHAKIIRFFFFVVPFVVAPIFVFAAYFIYLFEYIFSIWKYFIFTHVSIVQTQSSRT